MNKGKLQVGDLVFDPLYIDDGIGLVTSPESLKGVVEIYWFKVGQLEYDTTGWIEKIQEETK